MRTISRRRFLAGVATTAGLAACAPAAPLASKSSGPTVLSQPGSTVNITYWGSFSGNLGKAEQALVERFNSSQKDVHVDYQFQGSYEDTAQKLTAALQAKTAPDVSLLSDVWWFKFYLNNILLPLDDVMKQAKIDPTDYVDVLLKEGVRKNQTFWLPFARSTPIFYYNKDAWAKAGLPDRGPKTWDEFTTDWVAKLKGQSKVVFAHPNAASYIAWLFQGVIWQWGGQYSNADFKIEIDSPQGVAAGNFYGGSVKSGWAQPTNDIDTAFRTGEALATMGSTAGLAGHEAAAKFKVGAAFLPEGPAGFGCCTGGAGMAILSSTPKERQLAAMKWIDFATGAGTVEWSQSTGYMPVRKSAITGSSMADWYVKHPNFKTVVDQLPKTRPQDVARVYIPNGDQIIGKGLERITVAGENPDTVWKDVATTLTRDAEPVLRALKKLG